MGKARNQGREARRPPGDRRHHPATGAGSAGGEPDNTFSTDTVALRLSLSRTTARRYLGVSGVRRSAGRGAQLRPAWPPGAALPLAPGVVTRRGHNAEEAAHHAAQAAQIKGPLSSPLFCPDATRPFYLGSPEKGCRAVRARSNRAMRGDPPRPHPPGVGEIAVEHQPDGLIHPSSGSRQTRSVWRAR